MARASPDDVMLWRRFAGRWHPRAMIRWSLSALCLGALVGCAPPAPPPPSERPPIPAGERRCSPIEVPGGMHARRLVRLPTDELALVGRWWLANPPSEAPAAAGAIVRFDVDDLRALRVEVIERPIMDAVGGDLPYGVVLIIDDDETLRVEAFDGERRSLLFERREASNNRFSVQGAVAVGDGFLIAGVEHGVGGDSRSRYPSAIWLKPTPEARREYKDFEYDIWKFEYSDYGELGRGRDGPDDRRVVEGHAAAGLWTPTLESSFVLAGVVTESVDSGGVSSVERLGFFATRLTRLAGRGRVVFEFDRERFQPQEAFAATGGVLARDWMPWLLVTTGSGAQGYSTGKPSLVRIDPETRLPSAERIAVPLPEGASRGALLDAVELPGGDWIVGGAVCAPDHGWCRGWLARVDRQGGVVWSRQTSRDAMTAVVDLMRVGDRVVAALAGSPSARRPLRYVHHTAGLWIVDTGGDCATPDD